MSNPPLEKCLTGLSYQGEVIDDICDIKLRLKLGSAKGKGDKGVVASEFYFLTNLGG